MTKVDFRRELKHLYQPSPRGAQVVDVPALNFLMVDGAGDPNGSAQYADALAALYSVAYALKFRVRRESGMDYRVMPLEGLWWADDLTAFTGADRSGWRWTMMLMQPEMVTPGMVGEVVADVRRKKGLAALDGLRFGTFAEGQAAQLLHDGPFSAEGPSVTRLHAFIAERGELRGQHHEIYLSDVARAAPENWRTIIRQPFRPWGPHA